MTTRHRLTLINGTIDQEGSILIYQTVNSFEVHCYPYTFTVPSLPFPDDDDDRDDFDPAE